MSNFAGTGVKKCEFRGSVRFLEPGSSHMYDGNGNIAMCKCGKPGSYAIIGKSAYQITCADCSEKELTKEKYAWEIDYRNDE